MSQKRLFGAPERRTTKPARSANGYVSSLWDFPSDQDVSYAAHSIYRWYGTLPGPLVDRVLDLYGESLTSPVWDPMCGVGTTLVEARLRGVPAEGWDVNPLACLIAQAKLDPYPGAVATTIEVLHELREALTTPGDVDAYNDESFDYARKWFGTASLTRLLEVAEAVGRLQIDERTRRLLLIALASITRDVAEVDPRCTHHLVRKTKPFADALPLVESQAVAVAEALAAVPLTEAQEGGWSVQQRNCVSDAPVPKSDLVIAHPPYLGVIHYHLIHRLATELLRFVQLAHAPKALANLEFSPEVIRSDDASTDRDASYSEFLGGLASRLRGSTTPGGRAVVIIGDSRHRGHLRHPFTFVIDVLEREGLMLEENFIWILQNNGGMHIRRRGHHIDHNYILVFRNSG